MHSESQWQKALWCTVAPTSTAGHYAAATTASFSTVINYATFMSHWVVLRYLCFSTVHLWRVLNVRHTCGWTRPWGSGKGFEWAGWRNRTSQSLSGRSRGSWRRCCGHFSSSPSLLWNLVPMNKWMNNGELRGNLSTSTHSNSSFEQRWSGLPSPLLYSVPSK